MGREKGLRFKLRSTRQNTHYCNDRFNNGKCGCEWKGKKEELDGEEGIGKSNFTIKD